jgi:predicted RNase H-like nuclease
VGTGLFPEPIRAERRLIDVIDAVPSYTVIALAAPIGLPDKPAPRGRACEQEARRILGWPRLGAVASAPAVAVVEKARNYADAVLLNGGHLSSISWGQVQKLREIHEVVQSHLQRTVFEVHPELSFMQLNQDRPLAFGKRSSLGIKEREELLAARIQDLEGPLAEGIPFGATRANTLDAFAALTTARRIAARAVTRIPEQPEWNASGIRMEIVR